MPTSSVTEQIMVYLSAKLEATTGFAFYREREAPAARSEGLVGILEEDEEESAYQASGLVLTTFIAKVVIIARSTATSPAATIADSARVAVHAAIMKDQTLGGLAGVVTPDSTRWDREQADRVGLVLEMRYRIRFSTVINDLTQVL